MKAGIRATIRMVLNCPRWPRPGSAVGRQGSECRRTPRMGHLFPPGGRRPHHLRRFTMSGMALAFWARRIDRRGWRSPRSSVDGGSVARRVGTRAINSVRGARRLPAIFLRAEQSTNGACRRRSASSPPVRVFRGTRPARLTGHPRPDPGTANDPDATHQRRPFFPPGAGPSGPVPALGPTLHRTGDDEDVPGTPHHDDMPSILGRESASVVGVSGDWRAGLRRSRSSNAYWSVRDPNPPTYAVRLRAGRRPESLDGRCREFGAPKPTLWSRHESPRPIIRFALAPSPSRAGIGGLRGGGAEERGVESARIRGGAQRPWSMDTLRLAAARARSADRIRRDARSRCHPRLGLGDAPARRPARVFVYGARMVGGTNTATRFLLASL